MSEITPHFTKTQLLAELSLHYQLNGTLKDLPGYIDQNFLLTTTTQQYIVKVANSAEPVEELAMQNAAMAHLTSKALPVPCAVKNQRKSAITSICDEQGQSYSLRVLTYLEGSFYADAPTGVHQPHLWQALGAFVGKLDLALADFDHVGGYRYLSWDLAHGFNICKAKMQVLEGEQVKLVAHFLSLYQQNVYPIIGRLPLGFIHNDANDMNLLVDSITSPLQISGIIDFGDMVFSQVVNDLAITCAYALMNHDGPIAVLTHIVKSYHQIRPLTNDEIEVLLPLIALRLCVSVCHSGEAILENPENDYLLISAKPAWTLLKKLQNIDPISVACILKQACQPERSGAPNNDDIISFRHQHLSQNLSLTYQKPIKMIRGQGAYLYDEKGQAYLDMVNNVCHVGHCHPKVVAAGQQQMARLNTNTRYLHDNIITFAEKLLATMPDELSVCMFVNSGSEANELAFRLAKAYTKHQQTELSQQIAATELLVVDGAYHGNTNACIEASAYKFDGKGGEGAKDYVHKVTLPDPYRGKYKGYGEQAGQAYADCIEEKISQLEQQGKRPFAFICESLQGVGGQIIMPQGYLSAAYKHVRAVGGVCIADEVQVGFGRIGTHMWAFETQNVVPDIVTLGKPIGNGHPLAAVVTTKAIADAFVTGMEYFNTFGGNPVSCAIGSAVLDVIAQENLQQHALTTGDYLLQKLSQLQKEYDIIGDVRGLGLFIGVELIEDTDTQKPATILTEKFIEFFKMHHILLTSEGPFYNVFKIKPPIVFGKTEADKFLSVFELGLKSIT